MCVQYSEGLAGELHYGPVARQHYQSEESHPGPSTLSNPQSDTNPFSMDQLLMPWEPYSFNRPLFPRPLSYQNMSTVLSGPAQQSHHTTMSASSFNTSAYQPGPHYSPEYSEGAGRGLYQASPNSQQYWTEDTYPYMYNPPLYQSPYVGVSTRPQLAQSVPNTMSALSFNTSTHQSGLFNTSNPQSYNFPQFSTHPLQQSYPFNPPLFQTPSPYLFPFSPQRSATLQTEPKTSCWAIVAWATSEHSR